MDPPGPNAISASAGRDARSAAEATPHEPKRAQSIPVGMDRRANQTNTRDDAKPPSCNRSAITPMESGNARQAYASMTPAVPETDADFPMNMQRLYQKNAPDSSAPENLRDRPHERPILQGFAVFAADSAQGNIASSLAISLASRVV